MLVLEADLLCFRCLTTGTAQLDLPLIHPSLVGWRIFDIFRHLHFAIELQLFHEALVWFDDWACLPYVGQRLRWGDVIFLHQISNDACGRSRFSHGTRQEKVVGILEKEGVE